MLKKQLAKNQDTCKVTFVFHNHNHAETVQLVGDFNHWDENATPMKQGMNGLFSVTLELPKNQVYQYRYLTDHGEWHNDDAADAYVQNPFSGDNSVVST